MTVENELEMWNVDDLKNGLCSLLEVGEPRPRPRIPEPDPVEPEYGDIERSGLALKNAQIACAADPDGFRSRWPTVYIKLIEIGERQRLEAEAAKTASKDWNPDAATMAELQRRLLVECGITDADGNRLPLSPIQRNPS